MLRSFVVKGEPALWSAGADQRSVALENEWKDRIRDEIGVEGSPKSILMNFAVGAWTRRGHHFDLDNLVTPVLRAIYGDSNKERRESRAALTSWRAAVTQCPAPFVVLDFLDDPLSRLTNDFGNDLLIDDTWNGPAPENSRDRDFGLANWVRQHLRGFTPSHADRFAVHLVFGKHVRDITRPEEKPIKQLIDCLYPIFGGGPARGDDWKKVLLQVERHAELNGAYHIRCWLLFSGK